MLSGSESWGPGIAVVADGFAWTSPVRAIVFISDEAACNGGGSCNAADQDAVDNAIAVANQANAVVFGVTGFGTSACVKDEADQIALATGGTALHVDDLVGGYATAEVLLGELILALAGQ